jgi:putative Mg2+ transporter-C (MgtC) family protein
MITNLYISEKFPNIDPARMGAQVISGIGFLGAGTIIVTGRNRVKGLTTAAGLWASACVGLSIGVGFYSGAVIGCILILIVMAALHSLDDRVMASTKVINLYVEFAKVSDVGSFMEYIKIHEMKISDLEMNRSNSLNESGVAVLFTLRLSKKVPHAEIIHLLSLAEGVSYIEEV